MAQNIHVQTPYDQSEQHSSDDISAAQRAIIQRVLLLSLGEQQPKHKKKSEGLIPKYRKQLLSLKMTKSSQKCTVCYCQFISNQIIKKLPCRHIFHRSCAKSWFKISYKCPNCRLDLNNYFLKFDPCQQTNLQSQCTN